MKDTNVEDVSDVNESDIDKQDLVGNLKSSFQMEDSNGEEEGEEE